MSNFKGKEIRGYRLDVEIGAGGFGTVYHAYQEVLSREVAVKVIKEKYVNNPQFIRQFEAEARIIARLEHFNIVTLYDYWRDPSGAYLIMRWLRGGSLRSFLKTSQLDIAQMVRVVNQTATALSFAHQHNVIHRDIKPENILLDTEGNAFLTDFGIAVDLRNQDTASMENISFGSPDYVAPEQLKDKVITPRSDIYSMGIMLYELLAGERPFVSKDPKEIMKMQLFNPVPSLRLKRPDLPAEIDTIIWQSTAKNPGHRYDSVLELAVAFQNIAQRMETIPPHYQISTQRHRRLAPKPKPVSVTNLPTESVDATTGNLDDGSTGVLPDLAGEAYVDERNLDTIPDVLETGAFADSDSPDTFILDDDGEDAQTLVLDDGDTGTINLDTGDAVGSDDALGTVNLDTGDAAGSDDAMGTVNLDMGDAAGSDDAMGTINLNIDGETEDVEPISEDGAETNRFIDYRRALTLTIEGEGPPNPYKGLRAFEESDEGTFFGREELVARLVTDFGNDDKRFLALIGPSGSGKSSVVRAGMIPAFRRGAAPGSENWFFSLMIPGDEPFRELREAVLKVAMIAPENWGDSLERDPRGLHKLLNQILPDDGSDLLLFIDQFEEVFTLGDDEDRRDLFLSSLWFAVNQPDSRLRLVVTLRADFYDRPLHYPEFGQMLKENTEVVLPLNLQELESTIIGPADRVGLLVEPSLKNAIMNDIHNQPGALPLLQYALTELYDRKKPDEITLTYEQYMRIGGIEGALAQRAREIYATLSGDEQSMARKLFLRIIAIDDNGTVTRRRVLLSEMRHGIENVDALDRVVEAFTKYRLLTNDLDQATRTPTIEVAHEALIKGWNQLMQWIEQNRVALQKRQELRIEVDRWVANRRDKSYLATGSRLIEFEGLVNNELLSLRVEERDYITDSIALREELAKRQRRINLVLRVFSVVTLVLFVAALIAAYFANDARADAVEQAQVARSRELASASLASREQVDLSLLLAVEAYAIDDTYESRDSLLTSLQTDWLVQQYFHEHDGGLRAVDFDSTGTVAVSAGLTGQDNVLLRWDMTSRTVTGEPLTGHTSWISEVEISPDNTKVASASIDSTVRLWDIATGDELYLFDEHRGPVRAIRFSLDNTLLASAGEDGRVLIHDVESGDLVMTIELPDDAGDTVTIFDMDFTGNGALLATGSDDNMIRTWDIDSGELVTEFEGHDDWVNALQFDSTDTVIISADNSGVVNFWDVAGGQLLVEPQRTIHRSGINDLSLSFDGAFLATGGNDNRVIIWSLAQFDSVAILEPHQNRVFDVVFSPVDYRLLSASSDGNMLLSQLSAIQRPGNLVFDTNQTIGNMAVDMNSSTVVVAGEAPGSSVSTVQVLNRETLELDYEFSIDEISDGGDGEAALVTELAISADGERGAVSLSTGEVAVWLINSGDVLWIDNQHDAIPQGVVFTPDGQRVISADEAGTVVIWESANGEIIDSELYAPETGVVSLAISPNGQYLAIGGRSSSMLWNLSDQALITDSMTEHSNAIEAFVFSADSTTMFSASRDRSIGQWSTGDGTFIQRFEGHGEWVLSLGLNPDGDVLVSGDRSGQVIVWDVESARVIGEALQGPVGWLTDLQFVSDSTVLGSNREGNAGIGVVLSWSVDPADWATLACDIANRDLSDSEQLQFIRSADYIGLCSD